MTDTDLDMSHPVELVFGQVVQRAMAEPWDAPEVHRTEDLRDYLVGLIEQVAADPDNDRGAWTTITPVLSSRTPATDFLFGFLNDCLQTFRERSAKYAGSTDTWDATFVRAAEIKGTTPADVADTHVAVKIARREEGDGQNHDDDSLYDSYVDEINYRILSIALDRVHGGVVPGSVAARETVAAIYEDILAKRPRFDSRIVDSVGSFSAQTERTTAEERERITKESLQAEILQTYDHLRVVLESISSVGNVNHWRMPLARALAALEPTAAELRTCPICEQPAPDLDTRSTS